MLAGSSPLTLYDLSPRRSLMTAARDGVLPPISRPLIMRSAPAQASYWPNVGNWVLVKWAYFSRAPCICSVPALGNEKGRNSDKKYEPWSTFHAGDLMTSGSYPAA